jgi:very-short-patch-repair endonuclease
LPWAATREKLTLARLMRANPTQAEAKLWSRLRYRQVHGLKFRRQHIIAGYIVDLYCPALHLAVEVDGPHHLSQTIEDEMRDDMLGRYGVRVLRIDADAVMDDIDQVVEFIGGVATGKILPAVDDGSAPFPRFRGKG